MPDLHRRAELIALILDRYDEFVDPLLQSCGSDGDVGVKRMPLTYTRDVQHIEALLRRMRDDDHPAYWHLRERYLKAEQRIKTVDVKVKGKNGKKTVKPERQVLTVYHPRVDCCTKPHTSGACCQVQVGLLWLARNWRLSHEPGLPEIRDVNGAAIMPPLVAA